MNTTINAGNKAQMMNGTGMKIRNGEPEMTGRRSRFCWSLFLLGALLLGLSSEIFAAEMVTNGTFTGNATGWTLGGTNPPVYDGTWNGGSIKVGTAARNVTLTGTATQTVSIPAGSTISSAASVVAWGKHVITTGTAGTIRDITIVLMYQGGGSVQVFNATVPSGSAGAAVTNATATAFPLTLTDTVSSIVVTLAVRGGTTNPSGCDLYADNISITYTAPAIDALTATNTALATGGAPGASNLQMQHIQLSCSNTGNSSCIVTSATVDDVFIAAAGTITDMIVYIDADSTFGGALGSVTTSSWTGQSTVVDLTSIAEVNRTITYPTSKYLWVTYSINAGASNGTQLQSSVTAIGVLSPDTAPTGGPWNSNTITLSTGLTCSDCHTDPPTDGTRSSATGSVAGDHAKHVTTYGYSCDICHVPSAAYTSRHRNGSVQVVATIGALLNARYDKNGDNIADTSWAQAAVVTLGKCQNTACHGGTNAATLYGGPTGAGPTWGTSTSGTCTFCHNRAKTDSGVNADAYPTTASPFRSTTAVGAHAQHLTATSGLISGGVLCADCHTVPGTVNAAGHVITNYAAPADLTFSAKASLNSTTASYGSGTCTVYCHGTNMPGGDTSGTNEVNTSWTANWTNYPTGCTAACHGLPPTTGTSASTHSGQAFPTSCISCHADTITSTANPPGVNATFHINGVVEASGCTGCHGTDPKQYPPLSKWGANRSTADGVGAHVAHIEATATYMTKEAIAGETNTTEYWCAECHTTTRGAGGHNDGYPGEVAFTNAVEAKYNGHTATRTVEADGNPDLGNGTTCSVYCHGASMPNGDTLGTTRTPAWGVTLSGCNPCHGFPPTPTGTHSGVTLGTQCGSCHLSTMTNGNATITNTANHINGTLEVTVTCTGCHTGSGGGAKNVGPTSSHTDPDGAGATYAAGGNHCAVCHHADHAAETTNTIAVTWDTRTMGTNYTTGDFKIHLKKLSGTETSEAEICWNCHSGANMASISPKPVEFGNTQGAYQTGTLTVSSSDATPRSNWYTGYWRSANFAYKNLAINNATPGGSVHEAVTVYTADPTIVTTINAANVTKIGCSSCHDVHRLGNNGYTPTAAPYLRGTWISNPFKEDGAPQTTAHATVFGGVPRAGLGSSALGNSPNALGGWQIEQNNPGVYTRTGAYATFAGICLKCHTQATLQTRWTGHAAAVDGFNNVGAANIFTRTKHGGTTSYLRANMQHQLVTTTYNGDYVYGLRQSRATSPSIGISPQTPNDPTLPSMQAGTTGYNWAANMKFDDTATPDLDFHAFTCSKCHSPHASRLPRLMITNCLDVVHNVWDNTQGNPSTWNMAGKTFTAKQLAYSPTAVNCHRYVGAADANRETNATGETGWNNVTHW